MVLKGGKSSSSEIDFFIDLVLFQNKQNNIIDVKFDFLTSAFDMFNFFIYLLVKSIIVLSGIESIDVDHIQLQIVQNIKERFQFTGIQVLINHKEKTPLITQPVSIRVTGDVTKLDSYLLMVNTAQNTYEVSFSLGHQTRSSCKSIYFTI
jgi:hypothetical protein